MVLFTSIITAQRECIAFKKMQAFFWCCTSHWRNFQLLGHSKAVLLRPSVSYNKLFIFTYNADKQQKEKSSFQDVTPPTPPVWQQLSVSQHTLHHSTSNFFLWRCDPTRVMASSFLRILDHTQRRTTVGRTPLDEWSACRRDLYLTTHNTHNKHPCPGWDSNPRSQQASGRRPTP